MRTYYNTQHSHVTVSSMKETQAFTSTLAPGIGHGNSAAAWVYKPSGIRDVTSRKKGKVDMFTDVSKSNFQFVPDEYTPASGTGSHSMSRTKAAQPCQPNYMGHRPGAMDYSLGTSRGTFSRFLQQDPRQTTSATSTLSAATGVLKLPSLTACGAAVPRNASTAKLVMVSGTLPRDQANAVPTDHIITNQSDHWYGTRDGFTRKPNGGCWRSTQRTGLVWNPSVEGPAKALTLPRFL